MKILKHLGAFVIAFNKALSTERESILPTNIKCLNILFLRIIKTKPTGKHLVQITMCLFLKDRFPLGEMTSDFAAKLRRNYFTTKLYSVFTWTALTRLFKTKLTFLFSKIRISLLKMLNQTEKKNNFVNQTSTNSV